MNNTIENLQALELESIGFPNSIAPANQYSYLLTFNEPIRIALNNLIVKDLKDLYGSPSPKDTIQFEMDSTMNKQEYLI